MILEARAFSLNARMKLLAHYIQIYAYRYIDIYRANKPAPTFGMSRERKNSILQAGDIWAAATASAQLPETQMNPMELKLHVTWAKENRATGEKKPWDENKGKDHPATRQKLKQTNPREKSVMRSSRPP